MSLIGSLATEVRIMSKKGKVIEKGTIDLEPDWKEIAEWIIADGSTDKFADEIRQMANIASVVRKAQKAGCEWVSPTTGLCKEE